MYFSDGGYSDVQFNTVRLRAKAHAVAAVLPEMMDRLGADAVAVTGKSGLSLAFATLMLIDFPLIVVRKRGENSHGNPIEGTQSVNVRKYIILDDFVSLGTTIKTMVGSIDEMCDSAMANVKPLRCVGVLQYLRDGTGYSPVRYCGRYIYSIPVFSMAFLKDCVPDFYDEETEHNNARVACSSGIMTQSPDIEF